MHEEMTQQLVATAERLATAAEALDRVLGRIDSQQEALNAKVDRIVAAVEEHLEEGATAGARTDDAHALQQRIAELEKSNSDLKAQATRLSRKTLPPLVTALLSKHGETGDRLEAAVLDKTLQSLTVDQRIAVKAEMARAGMIE